MSIIYSLPLLRNCPWKINSPITFGMNMFFSRYIYIKPFKDHTSKSTCKEFLFCAFLCCASVNFRLLTILIFWLEWNFVSPTISKPSSWKDTTCSVLLSGFCNFEHLEEVFLWSLIHVLLCSSLSSVTSFHQHVPENLTLCCLSTIIQYDFISSHWRKSTWT